MEPKLETLILKDERNQSTLKLTDGSEPGEVKIRLVIEEHDVNYVCNLKEKEARKLLNWLAQALGEQSG